MTWASLGRNISDPVRWLVLFIALAATGFAGYMTFQQSRARGETQGPNHLFRARCKGCGTETPYGPALVNTKGKCSKCGREFTFANPAKEGSGLLILPGVMIGVVAILVSVWLFLTRSTRVREDTFYVFNCPGCKCKLRFQGSQGGRPGSCPRCDRACIFPISAEATE